MTWQQNEVKEIYIFYEELSLASSAHLKAEPSHYIRKRVLSIRLITEAEHFVYF
jgi:hypothetical protein